MAMSGRLDIALRASLLIAAGSALMALPLAVGLSAGTIVGGVTVGALAVALGLAGTGRGRGSLSVSAQAGFDRLLGCGLLTSGLALGIAGDPRGLAVFGGIGVIVLAVTVATRYTASTASI
jgi:hypothetical protein